MKLFVLNERYELEIDPIAYTLKPFKVIWDRDKSINKKQAQAELAYIYYMVDFKSDFFEISDLEERAEQIVQNLGLNIDTTDSILDEAIQFYADRTKTKLIYLLEDAYGAVDKLRGYFKEVDLTMVDGNGKIVHDSTKLLNNIGNLNKVVEGIKALEYQVKKEQQIDSKLRGGKEKGAFEDDV
jgi:predicted RNA-binding protein with EMAP domain